MRIVCILLLLAMGCTSPAPDPRTSANSPLPEDTAASQPRTLDTLVWAGRSDTLKATDTVRGRYPTKPSSEELAQEYVNVGSNGEVQIGVRLAPEVLSAPADTLAALAMEYYRMMEGSFPTSIADDFEHGVSYTTINYPRMYITFNVFKDGQATKPYTTKDVTVWMEHGSLRVE